MVTMNKGRDRLIKAAPENAGVTHTGVVRPKWISVLLNPVVAATMATATSRVAGTA